MDWCVKESEAEARSRAVLATVLVVAMLLAAACGGEPATEKESQADDIGPAAEPVTVFAVNYPLQYFAERIGGDLVRVVRPVPSAGDPAYWVPEAEVIAEIQAAELILLNGAGYAGWVRKASLPRSRMVDTSASFAERFIPLESGPTHSHGPQGEHSHEGFAFTTWLDPQQAIAQAEAVVTALVERRPQREESLRAGFERLKSDLEALDGQFAAAAERIAGEPLLFSHPVYQYFERRYGLDAVSVHWEPDAMPEEEKWRELGRLLEEHPARWMVWEGEPLAETVSRLSVMGIETAVVAPAPIAPASGDFLDRMQRNVAEVERMAPVESP